MAKKKDTKKTNQTKSAKGNKPIRRTKKELEELEAQQLEIDAIEREKKNRLISIAIFALSVLFFFIAVVAGEGIWNVVHNVYIGVFGWMAAIVFPLMCLVYSALFTAKKTDKNLIATSVLIVLIVFLLSSLIHVIISTSGTNLKDTIVEAYKNATTSFNGGFIGAVIGWVLLTMGKAPAIIVELLMIIVSVMLLSNMTVNQFFKKTATPVKKVYEKTAPYIEERRERKKALIDVPLDEVPPSEADEEPKKKTKRKKQQETETTEQEDDYSSLIAEINSASARVKKASEEQPKTIDEIVKTASEEPAQEEAFEVTKDDMKADDKDYVLPSIDLLKKGKRNSDKDVQEELRSNAELLKSTLSSFGVEAEITHISRGPTVTRYELKPASGVRIAKITKLADDIALNLAAVNVRIEAPIPGKAAIGIEIPNNVKNSVSMREVIEAPDFKQQSSLLSAGIGKDIAGKSVFCDVAKMPHLLIAGTTGSGKSVCMNSIIVSILYRAKPSEVKFLMIDPKKVEFSKYENIPHLLVPVVTDPRKASGALGWAVMEMLNRYQTFSDCGVRDIESYNRYVEKHEGMEPMTKVVICIDELADLMMAAPKEVEDSICRLAQMARAAGMHLIIATQRPSVDVITGLIKANISSRIALTVSSAIDSRTIIDSAGAEKLLGQGDMLYSPIGASKPLRVQGCYISDDEVEELCEFIKSQGTSEYSEQIQKDIESKAVQEKGSKFIDDDSEMDENLDPLFEDAVDVVLKNKKASTSFLQRKLGVGYSRGSKIMDQMEEKGIIGPQDGSKPRQILINEQQWIQMQAQGPAPAFTAENTEQMTFLADEDDEFEENDE